MKVLFIACVLSWPVEGPVVEPYAPIGSWGGHWGIDIAAAPASPIRSPAGGSVAFAGSVAGMRTVSIETASGLRVSLSYLSAIGVGQGDRVESGQVVGRSGSAHGADALHMSVRVGGRYVDPLPLLSCRYDLAAGLRLLEPEVRAS
jgi:murein DD-endopeptidase MepM/ murein hydrolase activator NlpD